MDIHEIRRNNLLQIVKNDFGGNKAELARKAEIPPSSLYRAISDHKTKDTRGVGDEIAAKVEVAAGKHKGWLDHIHALTSGADINGPHSVISINNSRHAHTSKINPGLLSRSVEDIEGLLVIAKETDVPHKDKGELYLARYKFGESCKPSDVASIIKNYLAKR